MRRKPVLLGLALLVAAAVAVACLWPAPVRTVTIHVTAPTGTKVSGTYFVDGVTSPIDADAPTEIVATGRSVTCSIRMDDRPGVMIVRIAVEGQGYASAGASAGGGVECGFRSGNRAIGSVTFWANTFHESP